MRRILWGTWLLGIIWFSAHQGAFGLSGQPSIPFFGGLGPLEKRFFDDAADGRLDEFSLLDTALIAGGVDDVRTLRHYEARLAAFVKELRRSGKVTGSPRRKAEAIFRFMHRRILHAGYGVDCTDLRIALDQGRFNCISATVLYNCLADEFGLRVCGVEMPGHATSRLSLRGGSIDVETTCPSWFRLIDDPKRQAAAVKKTVGTISAKARSQAREVSPIEIAAMVYYNRGVDLLARDRFREAAVANAKALRLDPASSTARGNLLATLNNWSIALSSANQYAEAVDLLRQGLAFAPAYEAFALNYVHVHHQWVEELCRTGRYREALEVLAQAATKAPDRAYFRRAPLEVHRRWTRAVAGKQKTEKPQSK